MSLPPAGKQNGFSSVEEARKRRSIEREARRRRRRERREKEAAGGRGHYDGLSSDDELLESNRLKFVNEMSTLCYVSSFPILNNRTSVRHTCTCSQTCFPFKHELPSPLREYSVQNTCLKRRTTYPLHLSAEEVSGKGKLVFEDVVEDFCRVSLIKERFEEWKFSFSDSYQQAFISLCLPKVFAPLVQLQMVDWNPLQVGPVM